MNANHPSINFRASSAFTLIDLLAVVFLIALGALMLVPALARTRTNSPALQCLNNASQIARGWIMYADDNGGSLVPNGGSVTNWVSGGLNFAADNPSNTNIMLLINHDMYPHNAYLGPYVGKRAAVFKCPGDHSTALEGGVAMPRVRSISMNDFVGAPGGPWSAWTMGSKYAVWTKLPQILSPAGLFVTLDEHAGSINDGCFASAPDTLYQVVDWPAAYHGNAGSFSFADGHSEVHKWKDLRTCPMFQQGVYVNVNVNVPGDPDMLWLAQHGVGLATYP